ncbi:MAG: enolase C-terminal domain-like protein [Vulcanimicrobiaceae bacterium]
MIIREIRARGFNLALQRPVETAGGDMLTTPLVLIDLLTQEGLTGKSYVRCYTPTALEPLVMLLRNLESVLKGGVAEAAAVDQKLQRHFRLLGPQGLTGIAMAGIDMALWDLAARAAEMPLYKLLGAEPHAIPAYASLRTMSPHGAAAEAEEHVRAGFQAIKVKIGRSDLAADLETIRAVRSAVGSNVRLMVDYNQNLSVDEALARAAVLDHEGLYWIEEPTRADDFAGHARIAASAATPIQLGENWWGPHDMEKSIAAHASDHVMLDVMKLGGVTGWLAAARLAADASLPASSHTFPEFSAHLLGVTPTAHYLEYLDHAGPILQEPAQIKDGMILPSSSPGSGLEWNEERLMRESSRK